MNLNTLPVSSYSLAMNGGYFDVSFSQPLSVIPKQGDRLSISIDDRLVFDGYVLWANDSGFRLINPIHYLGIGKIPIIASGAVPKDEIWLTDGMSKVITKLIDR